MYSYRDTNIYSNNITIYTSISYYISDLVSVLRLESISDVIHCPSAGRFIGVERLCSLPSRDTFVISFPLQKFNYHSSNSRGNLCH